MEPCRHGRRRVGGAADLIVAGIPAAQRPETKTTGRAITAGPGYVSRYVHLVRRAYPAPLAVWLSVVPAEHPYNFPGPRPRAGAGLMQDTNTELDENRRVAGLLRCGRFSWRRHNAEQYPGWRLSLDVEPDVGGPEVVAGELAAAVLSGLRQARLIP